MKFGYVFNYGFDFLMINQWENVKSLKCPIPTLPEYEYYNTTSTSTSTTIFNTTSILNQRPIYCIKDGAEIPDDLKIRPVSIFE